ncbi:MAG TPA: Lrp/AsnC family transcriptional regulator [Thermoplasmatales archaeon]|nr:Lrp/AsnC family transcriptional regulator [Thermoplasmatales archaeon]HEX08188.1 Lrp/AsnC family transcriptional regulator [Thermoplasmatales archaeon]
MYKLDVKDRKILYELDINCRQSNAQIGKKVGLGRDVVAYRIKRMQDEGIIKAFWTAIDTFRLGYNVYRIYINFDYLITPDIKKEIIQHFCEYKNAWAVLTVKGPVDFDAVIWVKDIYEFYRFWDKTLDKYDEYLAKYFVSIYIQASDYKKSYLLFNEPVNSNRLLYSIRAGGKSVQIDEIDYKILDELAINARLPLVELAEKLGCSSQSINYRIKNLIKNGIIRAFRVHIDYLKLGLQNFAVDLYLRRYKEKKAIIDYIQHNPHLFCLNIAVGWSDLGLEFVIENTEKLIKTIEDLNVKFPGAIKKYDIWLSKEVHRERWLPEIYD